MLNHSRAFAVGALLFALVFTGLGLSLPMGTDVGRIGAGFFPRIIGVSMTVLAAWNLLAAYRSTESDVTQQQDEPVATSGSQREVAIICLGMIVYFLGFFYLGIFVSTVAMCFGLQWLLGPKRPNVLVMSMLSLGLSATIYYLFFLWLNITPPETPLW